MAAGRLSGLDTAFLCLDRDVSPMHLGALAIFRPVRPEDPGRVAALLVDRVQRLPQLRQRVQPAWFPLVAATWADDPGFRAEDHIHLHHLDDHGGGDKVAALAAELMVRPLPRTRPLWEFHVISGLEGGRFALLGKMHHAFVDGLNALEIGLGVLDEFRSPDGDTTSHGAVDDGSPPSTLSPSTQPSMLSRLWHVAGDVRDAVGGAVGQMAEATGMAASVFRRVRLPAPGSPLLISSSGQRALATARLDLGQIRRIRAHHGGTVNDVLLSVVAGALRAWLIARGGSVEGLILRAFIPVSQRARSGNGIGGNRLSGYLCELPVGEPDPGKRLLKVRGAMEQSKAAGASRGAGAIPLLADQLPPAVHRVAAPVASQGASLLFDLMVTSVPLPGIQFTLDGAALEEIFPLAPLAAGQALVVGLSWYQDSAYVSLLADREGLPDVQRLAEAVQPAAAVLDRLSG
ncbi:MAG TPA: wax ester/triacylglycerol synthase family O-acyltransferase [Pseudonocardiaceae bacterium]|jgi:diacylglycerol O-acyltransferase|nr:wax ester/triacylglycerol synthase family O-acyltransferase [Pseudonocardiaceae bacterium]